MKPLRELVPWLSSSAFSIGQRGQNPFESLRREMNQLFSDFVPSVESFTGFGERGKGFIPRVDVEDDEREIVISAELPGIDEKDLNITLNDDFLSISGEKKHESERKEGKRAYYESSYGFFERVVPLNAEIVADKVEASLKKGRLHIRLPKATSGEKGTRKVSVKTT